jgi:hypothetical protein
MREHRLRRPIVPAIFTFEPPLQQEANCLVLANWRNGAGIGDRLMLLLVLIGCCAFIFYRIGEMDYGRGGLVATLSVVVSLLAVRFVPLSLISVVASQVLLYLALLFFNLIRKTPPRL